MISNNTLARRIARTLFGKRSHPFSTNGANPAGTVLHLPAVPRDLTGPPLRLDTPEIEDRWLLSNYDWRAWNEQQLPIMERYWDSFIRVYEALLPASLRDRREPTRGINLGTFNGCFQKAWMRLGYEMYGIEISDTISELHEYGCQGHRASVFDLSEVESASFDFAILDRVFCSPSFYDCYLAPEQANNPGRKQPASPPPFFAESFRILKPGGVFLGVFYPQWTEAITRELASHGRLTLWAIERSFMPYLVAMVETGLPPDPWPELAGTIAEIERAAASAGKPTAKRFAASAAEHPLVYHKLVLDEDAERLDMLFLPTAEIVELSAKQGETPKLVRHEHWYHSPRKYTFTHRPRKMVALYKGAEKPGLTVLADGPRWAKETQQGYAASVDQCLGKQYQVVQIKGKLRGVYHALSHLDALAAQLTGETALVSIAAFDSRIAGRTGEGVLRLQYYLPQFQALIEGLIQRGIHVLGFDPLPQCPESLEQSDLLANTLRHQNQETKQYAIAAAEVFQRNGCPVLRLWDEFDGQAQLYEADGIHLSKAGATLLGDRLLAFAAATRAEAMAR